MANIYIGRVPDYASLNMVQTDIAQADVNNVRFIRTPPHDIPAVHSQVDTPQDEVIVVDTGRPSIVADGLAIRLVTKCLVYNAVLSPQIL